MTEGNEGIKENERQVWTKDRMEEGQMGERTEGRKDRREKG